MRDLSVILFDEFTLLDAFGPIEVFAKLREHYSISLYSRTGGEVRTHPEIGLGTHPWTDLDDPDIVLVPGGWGTRELVHDDAFIGGLGTLARKAKHVLSVCTGSALLARTGLLDGIEATSNKRAFDWVASQRAEVRWQRQARWVRSGDIYTSSGVTAGIDMALGFVSDHHGQDTAKSIAEGLEYRWSLTPDQDPFAR